MERFVEVSGTIVTVNGRMQMVPVLYSRQYLKFAKNMVVRSSVAV